MSHSNVRTDHDDRGNSQEFLQCFYEGEPIEVPNHNDHAKLHVDYGYDMFSSNMDNKNSIWMEYNDNSILSYMEYKNHHETISKKNNIMQVSRQASKNNDGSYTDLPAYIVILFTSKNGIISWNGVKRIEVNNEWKTNRDDFDNIWYLIVPTNKVACNLIGKHAKWMTELEYVRDVIYKLRDKSIPNYVSEKLFNKNIAKKMSRQSMHEDMLSFIKNILPGLIK